MANTIKLKRGTSTPTTSDISNGEVAIDTSAKKLYVNDSGTVKEIGGGSGGGVTSDAQFNTVGGTNAGDSFTGTDATDNTLFGYNAGTAITSGDQNTCVGFEAGKTISTAARLTAIGRKAGTDVTGQNNTIVGANTGLGINSGTGNTIMGVGACETGNASNVVAVGNGALAACTTTSTAVGVNAGKSITNGGNSTFIGYKAGENTTGNSNTIIGDIAFTTTNTGSQNTAVGYEALTSYADTGANPYQGSVAVGRRSLMSATTGNHNVSVGRLSAYSVSTGCENTILGALAGYGTDGTGALTTGSNNILIGYQALSSAVGVSNEVTIGNSSITKFRVPALNFIVKSSTATEGHVLTVDANGEAGFAAASGGGKLTLISNTTFTSAAAAVTFTSISGYTQYKIMFSLNTSGAGTLRMRVGIDGTYDTGDNYNKGGSSGTSMQILGGFSAKSKHGEILISHLNQTKSTQVHSIGVGESNDATDSNMQTQSNGHRTTTAQNSIQIFGSSGDLSSGTISLYGIATS